MCIKYVIISVLLRTFSYRPTLTTPLGLVGKIDKHGNTEIMEAVVFVKCDFRDVFFVRHKLQLILRHIMISA